MDFESKPSKEIIENVFNRLKQQACNKICFDCGAKNPTWSSVTFGIFICIDCSAVHRNLGVHLTFVRSINLDTNWTWLQLWQMELGGNANASQFFKQHNCISTDSQIKYNSRVAHLYKDKLLAKTSQAMKKFGTKIEMHSSVDKSESNLNIDEPIINKSSSTKDDKHDNNNPKNVTSQIFDTLTESTGNKKNEPSVDFLNSTVLMNDTKSAIGNRKPQQKKSNIGMKKRGLGATKVTTNFADIEKRANTADIIVDRNSQKFESDEFNEPANLTLAFQNLSVQKSKAEDRIRSTDPQKAKQIERLGMGVSFKGEVAHSALTDMQTINAESVKPQKSLEREEVNDFFDEESSNMYNSNKSDNMFFLNNKMDFGEPQVTTMFSPISKGHINEQPIRSKTEIKTYEDTTAQKKFGGAKGISSKQFFEGDIASTDIGYNHTRFEGSSGISSADYFQNDAKSKVGEKSYSLNVSHHDMDDVKESVRQGVTKVAGRLSSLANDVMSSLQEKYGY